MLKNFVKYRSVKQNLFSILISKDIYCNMVMLFVYTTHRVVKQIWPVVRKYYPILSIVDLLHNYWYLFNLININKCTSYQTTWYPIWSLNPSTWPAWQPEATIHPQSIIDMQMLSLMSQYCLVLLGMFKYFPILPNVSNICGSPSYFPALPKI